MNTIEILYNGNLIVGNILEKADDCNLVFLFKNDIISSGARLILYNKQQYCKLLLSFINVAQFVKNQISEYISLSSVIIFKKNLVKNTDDNMLYMGYFEYDTTENIVLFIIKIDKNDFTNSCIQYFSQKKLFITN